jgi:hypothetical protein
VLKISEIGALGTSLVELVMNGNNLYGRIPSEIGLLRKATFITLSGCHFEGTIPSEIGGLESVLGLDLGTSTSRGPGRSTVLIA